MHNITISNNKPFGASLEKIHSFKKNPDFYELIFEKVRLKSKQDELIRIFESEDPGHYEKLYFCGFLLNALNITPDELLNITVNQSAWSKKDIRMHYNQIKSVVKSIKHYNKNFSDVSVISDSEHFLTHFVDFENNELTETESNWVKKRMKTENNMAKTVSDFEPKSCQIEDTHVTCYYKKCDSCKLKGHSFIGQEVIR